MLLSLHLQTDARSTRQLDTSTCSISKSTVQNPTGFLRIGWIFLPAGLISHPFWMKILIECQVYSKWSTQGAGLYNKLYRLQYGHLVSPDSLTLPCGHKIMLFVHYYSLWNEYSFFFDCSQLNFCFVFLFLVFVWVVLTITIVRRAHTQFNNLLERIHVWPGILPDCDYRSRIRYIQRQ